MNDIVDIVESFKKRNKTALIYKNDFRTFRWSYKKIYSYIRKFSNFLKKNDVKPGDRVLLWGQNMPEWVIVHLGTIYYRAVIVPADMLSTPEAVDKIIENSQPKLIIKTKFRPALKSKVQTFYIEELEYLIEDLVEFAIKRKPKDEDLVELVYTSGTTGDPKGVMLNHSNIVSNMASVTKRISITEKDCLLSLLPLSHMLEQMGGMFASLSCGASVIHIRSLKPTSIFNALEEEDVTAMMCVPRILQSIKLGIRKKASRSFSGKLLPKLMKIAEKLPLKKRKFLFGKIHKKIGKNFRFFVSGGAPLDEDTQDFWNLLGFQILQGYGLTECSPVLTIESESEFRKQSIGKALPGVQVKIDDGGEIMAKGPNIFSGYYKNKEKTKEAFKNGWFLTGDIGEVDEDGFFFIKGRKKDVIVTSSGLNVYPEDIEDVLNNLPNVKESCVVGIKSNNAEEAHAVLILEKKSNVDKIIDKANESLDPSQKIMSYTVWKELEFPKTSTLKIKKNIVREKIKSKKFKEVDIQQCPKINIILSQVCKTKPEKIKNSMKLTSDLKIDSIGRVELVSLIEKEYNIDFEEELINNKTTVKNLEGMIKKKEKGNGKIEYPSWNRTKIIRLIRRFWRDIVHKNFFGHFGKVNSTGLENLKNLKEPVILAPNHVSFLDWPVVYMCLPKYLKYNTSAPAYGEFFDPQTKSILRKILGKFAYFYALTFFAAYPMPQTHSFTKSLRYTGKLVDQGDNIIIFPEGQRTRLGYKMEPFMDGTALLIQNLKIPVIPIGIGGMEQIYPYGWKWAAVGKVYVNFGKIMHFKNESKAEINSKLKKEIERLRKLK